MPGKIKNGLEYAGWNTDIFDNDTKIDELIDAQGWIGFSIYFYLCQKAYGSEGYFYKWSYCNAPTTARKMGGGIKSKTVESAVGTCLRIGLFDNFLFDELGILTSRGIQKRYVKALEKRNKRKIILEYWLLNKEESGCAVIIPEISDSLPENDDSLPENAHSRMQSKVKESKGKESCRCTNTLHTLDSVFDNHFGDYDDDSRPCFDTVENYISTNIGGLSSGNMQEVESIKRYFDDSLIRKAVDEACSHKARNWAYVKKILRSYWDNGLKSLQDVEEYENRRNKTKETSNQGAEPKIRWVD